ncbi:MAG: indolepyruvate ferredoxin oxidoreductase, alpha subunit [Desulfonauticus sp.]|nr:indolepyruvate ferredoxin oxidoreductase, alpha subunit [Desulfonauticus sp.]
MSLLLKDEPGKKVLLLGNEAIVRGALEAGVSVVSCYPGTPSSEVPDTFYRLQREQEVNYYFEYSVNEKVAMEVAGGAALGGVPSLVTMKHVGVNVAADPLFTLAYIGTPGGMVILSADDPFCHSSQNEQDNRYYARMAGLPCFEPSSAQECKDMTREAFRLSKKYEQPFLLRTTTRVNHLRGEVVFDSLAEVKQKGSLEKNPGRFVPIPVVARERHKILLEKLEAIKKEVQKSPFNKIWGEGNIGIVVSGISRAYLKDVLTDHPHFQFKVLELGFTYPLSEELILEFLQGVDRVLVLEELEPLVEKEIRNIVQQQGLKVEVWGKNIGLPLFGEYSTVLVAQALFKLTNEEYKATELCVEEDLAKRPPNLCAGCPHRSVYYRVRKIFGDDAYYSSDIGCYTLGILPPLKMADFLLCMGSSVSAGSGLAIRSDKPVIAFIGDSTFFHSGLTGLANAVYNQHDILLFILDNKTTAMTGHQPHPGVTAKPMATQVTPIEIEPVVRALGVNKVKRVKALNQKALEEAILEFKEEKGVRVIITEEPCPLFARKVLGVKKTKKAYISAECDNCLSCVQELACPAFYIQDGQVKIDEVLCAGCMVCLQVCKSIKAR